MNSLGRTHPPMASTPGSKLRNWDSIPKQTIFSENGKVGDCWRCCVAAVLGLPSRDVPHFMADSGGRYDPFGECRTQDWLALRGYGIVGVAGRRSFVFHRTRDTPVPPLISCGPTVRSSRMGQNHAVVTNGDELLYDPHPSNAGLTAIVEQFLIFRHLE